MAALPKQCQDSNTVAGFCGCMKDQPSMDPAAEAFCKRAESGGSATGDELAELKMALSDLDEDCCEC